jgi:hypothetical protein
MIDQKAFFAESKRLQEEFGMTRDQADMLAAHKFWAIQREKRSRAKLTPEPIGLKPVEGEHLSRRPTQDTEQ